MGRDDDAGIPAIRPDDDLVLTIPHRLIDLTPDGVVDRLSTYDDFLANETGRQQLQEKYKK